MCEAQRLVRGAFKEYVKKALKNDKGVLFFLGFFRTLSEHNRQHATSVFFSELKLALHAFLTCDLVGIHRAYGLAMVQCDVFHVSQQFFELQQTFGRRKNIQVAQQTKALLTKKPSFHNTIDC